MTDETVVPLCTKYDRSVYRRCGQPCKVDPATGEYLGACAKHLGIMRRAATMKARREEENKARTARYKREQESATAEAARRREVRAPLITALDAVGITHGFTRQQAGLTMHSVMVPEEHFDRLVKALELLKAKDDSEAWVPARDTFDDPPKSLAELAED